MVITYLIFILRSTMNLINEHIMNARGENIVHYIL